MKSGLANLHQFDVSTFGHAAQSGRGRGGALVGVSDIAVATRLSTMSGGEWREVSVLRADGGDLVSRVHSGTRRTEMPLGAWLTCLRRAQRVFACARHLPM